MYTNQLYIGACNALNFTQGKIHFYQLPFFFYSKSVAAHCLNNVCAYMYTAL